MYPMPIHEEDNQMAGRQTVCVCARVALLLWGGGLWAVCGLAAQPAAAGAAAPDMVERVATDRGGWAVLGLPGPGQAEAVNDLVRRTQMLVYFQSPDAAEVDQVRKAAEAAGY